MKRILSGIICVLMVLTVASCSAKPAALPHVDGELTDIFKKIYENAGVEAPGTFETAVTDANKVNALGSTEVEFIEGLTSDAMIMTIPHSMVLIRVDEASDIEKTKQIIRDNVDPRKWICVGVEADQVIVDSIGDLIFLVMSADAKAYHESFLKLADAAQAQ